jgi:hypothetical protein
MWGDASQAPVAAASFPCVLRAALEPHIGLALWLRAPRPALAAQIESVTAGTDFEHVAEGSPEEASSTIMQVLSHHGANRDGPLEADLMTLATMFIDLCGVSALRLRLEHTREVTCPRLHVDAVGLRLLCTYAGPGTEWRDGTGAIQRMSPAHVGVFKGRAWPDGAPRVLHRSPDMSDLSGGDRGRLVLCLDRLSE